MDEIPCTYRISVKAAITDAKGRILLLREKDGSWELPGGGLEHGETAKYALVREITEETGMTVEWISEQPQTFWTIRKEVGSPTVKWFAFILYEAKVSGDFKPDLSSEESQAAQYFTVDETKQLKLHENTRPYFV